MSRVGIGLFGVGSWAQRSWLPAVSAMVEDGEASLTVVDLPRSASQIRPASPQLDSLMAKADAAYIPWATLHKLDGVEVMVIAAPAKQHLEVLQRGLDAAGALKCVICEKPCGDSPAEFRTMRRLCARSSTRLTVADHYLLRPQLAAWRAAADSRNKLAAAEAIRAVLLERNRKGPSQDVSLDMLVHVLNILRVLYPESRFCADAAWFARALVDPHADVTHALVRGRLQVGGRRIPCTLEVGKSAAEDRKELALDVGDSTEELINLDPGERWSYLDLLQTVVRTRDSQEEVSAQGAVGPRSMLRSWAELEKIQRVAQFVGEYPPHERPRLPTP